MAYTPYYSNGWVDSESGGTPITAEALNNMESGIGANDTAVTNLAASVGTFASGYLTITSRNNIPRNYIGGVTQADGTTGILPSEHAYNLIAFGISDNNRALIVSRGSLVYYSAKSGGTWSSWQQITLS